MKNKFRIFIILFSIFLGGFVFFFLNIDIKIGYEVCIYNNTEDDIKNLEIVYATGESIEIVSKIEAGECSEMFVNTRGLEEETL